MEIERTANAEEMQIDESKVIIKVICCWEKKHKQCLKCVNLFFHFFQRNEGAEGDVEKIEEENVNEAQEEEENLVEQPQVVVYHNGNVSIVS